MSNTQSNQSTECVHCGGPATHQHAITGTYLCCGHAHPDIDANPISEDHTCESFYTVQQSLRDGEGSAFECEHRDNPNPPTGDLVPCHEPATWEITTSKFPGDTLSGDHPGAPTSTKYCDEHFADRLRTITERAEGDHLEMRPRDWTWVQ